MKKLRKFLSQFILVICLSTAITPNIAITNSIPIITIVQAAYNKETIYDVQEALNDAGYDCGTPDGISGKNTKAAIKKYQKDNDLKVTGKINKTLLKSLGITVTKSTTTSTTKVDTTVYVTRTGAKYHRSGCRYLRQSKISISLSDAKKSYDPCSVCKP